MERLVEGAFARAFRSGLQPVEIARRLERDLDTGRTLDAKGHPIGPNRFVVHLSSPDFEKFGQIQDSLRLEFIAAVREHAQDRGLLFLGRVGVLLVEDEQLRTGRFRIDASFADGEVEGSVPAYLEVDDGQRISLGAQVAVIGRSPESGVFLDDPNVSRHHAELRPDGDSYVLVDLASTNGTWVNGVVIREHRLSSGDMIGVGQQSMTFHLL